MQTAILVGISRCLTLYVLALERWHNDNLAVYESNSSPKMSKLRSLRTTWDDGLLRLLPTQRSAVLRAWHESFYTEVCRSVTACQRETYKRRDMDPLWNNRSQS